MSLADSTYRQHCDLLVGLDGFHVIVVAQRAGGIGLHVVVESAVRAEGCRSCGVIAASRHDVTLVDVPVAGRPVRLV